MRQVYTFGVLLLVASAAVLSGCYTQVASDGGAYYGYGHRPYRVRSFRSDTITSAQAQPKSEVRYDTTMKGDTMFIEEKPVTPSAGGGTEPSEEIVNNYYDDGSYWPYYWPPSPAFAISFGWPYRSWYNYGWPSYYAWDYWGYPGFYPPIYDVYAPFYGYGYGYGIYDHGFYGPRFGRFGYGGYGRYAYGGYGGYPYSSIGRGSSGRGASGIGEGRSITLGPSRGGNPSSISIQNNRGEFASNGRSFASAASMERPSVAESRLSEVSGDRNSPIHAVAPDSRGTMNSGMVTSNSASSRPVVVRRSANGTTTTTMANGRQYVVVRRGSSSGLSSRSFGPSGRSNGYNSSARGYGGARSSYGGVRASSGNSSSGRSSGGGSSSGGRGGGSSSSGGGGRGGGSSSSGGGGGRGGR